MTDNAMNLHALVGKSADADFLREMIGFAAQRLTGNNMEMLAAAVRGVGIAYGPSFVFDAYIAASDLHIPLPDLSTQDRAPLFR